MGQSPAQKAAEAAKSAVEDALRQQKQLVNQLQNRTKSYTNKYERTLEDLSNLTGTTAQDYIPGVTKQFYETLGGVRGEFQPKLEDFQPDLLSSSSYAGLAGQLLGMSSEYEKGMSAVSDDMSKRLWSTLEAPQASFTASSLNPAFENLLNPQYMALATRPPTVKSDVDSMMYLTKYNV
jgi:hypothetical protein